MNQNDLAFNFNFIPLDLSKSSVKIFQNIKESFSLEYAIFEPKNVQINMYPTKKGWFPRKNTERGFATIKQFASSMGLHPDFHEKRIAPIGCLLKLLQTKFRLDYYDQNSPSYYCGGILVTKNKKKFYFFDEKFFIDNILEILTDNPKFAYVQLLFQSKNLPKEFKDENEEKLEKQSQVRFDIQQGRIEQRYNLTKDNLMKEVGSFEVSPRLFIVETSLKKLKAKLNQISVLFISNGFRTRKYPTFWNRFSFLKKICLNRKMVSPIVLDGYSLMNIISPPQYQFSHKGYIFVPNKNDYSLSSGITKESSRNAINFGISIISGKTANVPLMLEGKDINRHMAVFGMTGEGKSRFIYGLVREFYQKSVKFLIFDLKGEYLLPVKSFCSNFIYLKPGSDTFPWGINIFQIPKDKEGKEIIPIEDHIQFVVSILENIFIGSDDVSPQMRRLLHLAIIKTIEKRGNMRDFISWINKPNELGIKGTYLENTSAGIVNRIEKLFFGNTGRCFTVEKTTFEISELLDFNAIIDLSSFEAIEDQKGRQIFLEIIFQYLYYYLRSFRIPFKNESLPKNVFILDEIQKLLPKVTYRAHTTSSIISRGPWTLRAYDVSMLFIGTDPIIDEPILNNAGILTIFYTNFDAYKIANLLGIPKQDYEQLRKLLKVKADEHRCIVSINGNVSLMKTNDFHFKIKTLTDYERMQDSFKQQQLFHSYKSSVFNPIKEFKSY